MKTIFEEKGGTYSQVGDYLLPDVILPTAKEGHSIGKFGRLHKKFLEENKKVLFTNLLVSGKLFDHLSEIDARSKEMFELLTRQLAEKESVTEKLKSDDKMAWVGAMNNIRHRAEEIVLQELIYI